ncbi:MAG: radical SAM protein [Oscillospiraceae bacterium]|nr:radical SAM protein [Oscillospiraceae bacterium]
MYYRLKAPWAFRGWERTPYAIQAQAGRDKHKRPYFFRQQPFLELLYCNGEEEVDLSSLSAEGRQIFGEFLANGILEQSETPMSPLESWQRYHVFPARYVETVHWSITGKCNFNCRHCLVSAPNAHHPQLPLDDCLHIVDEIARCGIRRVDITGGEPLVRKDFEQIVESLSRYGIDIGVLFTNASLLSRDIVEMLRKHHQRPAFQLSFDGLGHHDWLRGVPGAEQQADAAFRLLQEIGAPVTVAMCIHKGNRDSLSDTVRYLAGYGVQTLRLNAPQELGLWREYADEYALSEDEVWETYAAYLPRYFADGMPLTLDLDGYFHCRKGSTKYSIPYIHHPKPDTDWTRIPYCESVRWNTYISPEGLLAPCMGFSDTALKERFPSVLEHPLSELTLAGTTYDIVTTSVADLLKKNPECAACPHLPQCCGGCMLESMTEDGDYLVPDQRICYFFKHIGEAKVREAADAAIRTAGLEPENKKTRRS